MREFPSTKIFGINCNLVEFIEYCRNSFNGEFPFLFEKIDFVNWRFGVPL